MVNPGFGECSRGMKKGNLKRDPGKEMGDTCDIAVAGVWSQNL
jgi:hypothetical protein